MGDHLPQGQIARSRAKAVIDDAPLTPFELLAYQVRTEAAVHATPPGNMSSVHLAHLRWQATRPYRTNLGKP